MVAKILCVIGTRPEAIKMAPVIRALKDAGVSTSVVVTAQHRELLDQMLEPFGLHVDRDLDVMTQGQTLAGITTTVLNRLDPVLGECQPDMVLAQGDTTTVFCTSLACFYRGIPFGHVEAGLRTGDLAFPFPEELNRVLVGRLARLHFAPTEGARSNLLTEGVPEDHVHVTGNTVVDSVLSVAEMDIPLGVDVPADKRLILMTAHRRENFGAPLHEAFEAVRELAERYPDVHVVYPVHPNPNVRESAFQLLGGSERITLCDPLDYFQFVQLLKRCYMVISDSGGIQEEAPTLGKPILVLRRETERPEVVEAGLAQLVGTDRRRIVEAATVLLDDGGAYQRMSKGGSLFGDGHASEYIRDIILQHLSP